MTKKSRNVKSKRVKKEKKEKNIVIGNDMRPTLNEYIAHRNKKVDIKPDDEIEEEIYKDEEIRLCLSPNCSNIAMSSSEVCRDCYEKLSQYFAETIKED